MPKKLAFMTIGVLAEPFGEPGSQGFVDRVTSVFAAADSSGGFAARSDRDMETYERSWGEIVIPKCYSAIEDPLRLPSTLSIWHDLESVAAYAYHGAHGEAMVRRREWFLKSDLPGHVAWWIDADRIDPIDAADRLDHLYANGPTPFAFSFANPFDAEGNPYNVDSAQVRAKVAANAEG